MKTEPGHAPASTTFRLVSIINGPQNWLLLISLVQLSFAASSSYLVSVSLFGEAKSAPFSRRTRAHSNKLARFLLYISARETTREPACIPGLGRPRGRLGTRYTCTEAIRCSRKRAAFAVIQISEIIIIAYSHLYSEEKIDTNKNVPFALMHIIVIINIFGVLIIIIVINSIEIL